MSTVPSTAVTLRPLDPAADLELLHGWMQEPHVAAWWELEGPVRTTAAYLETVARLPHQHCLIAERDGVPFAYVETYVCADDALADHYDTRPGDRGLHLLVGPPQQLGTGAARELARLVIRGLLAEPGADRVLCEPDVRNARMLAFCAALGGEHLGTIALPDKRAALIAWTAAP